MFLLSLQYMKSWGDVAGGVASVNPTGKLAILDLASEDCLLYPGARLHGFLICLMWPVMRRSMTHMIRQFIAHDQQVSDCRVVILTLLEPRVTVMCT